MHNFQSFTARYSRSAKPCVRLGVGGWLALNRAAYEALGSPRQVELLFDAAAGGTIGIRAATQATAPHSFACQPIGRVSGCQLRPRSFLNFHGINVSERTMFAADVVDGTLVVSLNEAVPSK